jgi:hypothetical protein
LSSAIAFVGAWLNSRDDSDIFFDNLDNEVDPGAMSPVYWSCSG